MRFITDTDEVDADGYISFSVKPLADRVRAMAAQLSEIHNTYNKLLYSLPQGAFHSSDDVVEGWSPDTDIGGSVEYEKELSKHPTINSIFKQGLTHIGYLSAFNDPSHYGTDPLQLRAKFLVSTSHTHPLWRGSKLVTAEYRSRIADVGLEGIADRYAAQFYEFAKPFVFSRDNDPLQLVYGMKYCAPSIAFDMTPNEAAMAAALDVTFVTDANGSPNDHHWKVMNVYTKYCYTGCDYLLWLWIMRGWLSIRTRTYLEDNPHFVIPDALLPLTESIGELSIEDEDVYATLCLVTKSTDRKKTHAKQTVVTEVYNVSKCTTEVRQMTLDKTKVETFIGYDSSVVSHATMLPYYVQKQGANPGRGYFAKRELFFNTEQHDEAVSADRDEQLPPPVTDSNSPLHWKRFQEVAEIVKGPDGKVYMEVIPLFRVYHSKLPSLLAPAKERKFPYVPREEDPCMRRWKYSLDSMQDVPMFYLPIPIWDATTEAKLKAYDVAVAKAETKREAIADLKSRLCKHPTKTQQRILEDDGEAAVAKAQENLDDVMALSCERFCKKLPSAMKQQLNTMNAVWRSCAIDAIERVVDQVTADWVFIYLRALIDEHERLEQLRSRVGLLTSMEREVITATIQLASRPASERRCTSFDLPPTPPPPRMPAMGVGYTTRGKLGAVDLVVDKAKSDE